MGRVQNDAAESPGLYSADPLHASRIEFDKKKVGNVKKKKKNISYMFQSVTFDEMYPPKKCYISDSNFFNLIRFLIYIPSPAQMYVALHSWMGLFYFLLYIKTPYKIFRFRLYFFTNEPNYFNFPTWICLEGYFTELQSFSKRLTRNWSTFVPLWAVSRAQKNWTFLISL